MARPRLQLPEHDIATAYANGATIANLARTHGVDRYVIRRIITTHDVHQGRVIPLNQLTTNDVAPHGYTTGPQLAQAANITYRQLDFWTRCGLLHPAGNTRPGTGHLRVFPTTEVPVAKLIAQLLDAGLTLRAAHDHARRLLEQGHTHIAGITVHLPEEG